MAIELTKNSIYKLCNGTLVQQPIVQLLGYEAVEVKMNEINYRLVLSDGVHMNSYFFLCSKLNDLIVKKEVKYGTILKIEKYRFMDGENCSDHSSRWIIFIEKLKVMIHRNIFGYPQPLTNIEKKKKPLINLNLNDRLSRVFNSIEQLENNLISVEDLNNLSNGLCSSVLKLTVVKKYPINTYSRCKILNINMEDSTGMVRVSAFNSIADKMNEILEENKMYYLTDTTLKRSASGCELKMQSTSVIIECVDQAVQDMQCINIFNFNKLLNSNLNTFCDLIGVCLEISDIEVCCNSNSQTEIAKREIILIDMSMATVTLKVWGELVNAFDKKFDDPPVVMVKQAVLKQFNGVKYFSMIKNSILIINPDTDDAHQLKEWYKEMVIMEDL